MCQGGALHYAANRRKFSPLAGKQKGTLQSPHHHVTIVYAVCVYHPFPSKHRTSSYTLIEHLPRALTKWNFTILFLLIFIHIEKIWDEL